MKERFAYQPQKMPIAIRIIMFHAKLYKAIKSVTKRFGYYTGDSYRNLFSEAFDEACKEWYEEMGLKEKN